MNKYVGKFLAPTADDTTRYHSKSLLTLMCRRKPEFRLKYRLTLMCHRVLLTDNKAGTSERQMVAHHKHTCNRITMARIHRHRRISAPLLNTIRIHHGQRIPSVIIQSVNSVRQKAVKGICLVQSLVWYSSVTTYFPLLFSGFCIYTLPCPSLNTHLHTFLHSFLFSI